MFNRSRLIDGMPRWLAPALFAIVFLLLAGLYRSQTPLFETPDEPSHFSVAEYIATWGRLPPPPTVFRTGPVPAVSENPPNYYAPPLYYLLAAPLLYGLDTAGYSSNAIPNPYFELGWAISAGDDLTSKNMYAHSAEQRSPAADWAIGMQRMRTLSMLIAATTVVGAALVVRRLWPDRRQRGWRWSAMALIVLNPTFLFTSFGISNDVLLVALSTWCYLICIDIVSIGDAHKASSALLGRRGFLLALLFGCAVLTKQSGLLLAAPISLTIILVARHADWGIARVTSVFLIGTLLTLSIAGWWYARNAWLAGDPLALEPHPGLTLEGTLDNQLRFLGNQLLGAFKSYWAALGWATMFAHEWWYLWFATLTIGGLAGWPARTARLSGMAAGIAPLLWSGLGTYMVFLVIWLMRTAAPYGRLMFPIIVPAACILIEGWRRWLIPLAERQRWLATLFQGGVILSMLALALMMPIRYLRPAFESPVASREKLKDAVVVNSLFDDRIRLLGYTVNGQGRAGDSLELTLYWEAASAQGTAADYMTEIQLAPTDAESWVAGDIVFLGSGRYPSSLWQSGDLIVQKHQLRVPADSLAPALYWFGVGLTPEPGGERLPVTSGLPAGVGDLVRLGPIRLYPSKDAEIEPVIQTEYQLGTVIELPGYDIEWNESDRTLRLVLFWRAVSAMPDDWTVFVHLVDPTGTLVAQADAPPVRGNFPTSWWQPGDVVVDPHELLVPPGIELQELTLNFGLYDVANGERLPVMDAHGVEMADGIISVPIQR